MTQSIFSLIFILSLLISLSAGTLLKSHIKKTFKLKSQSTEKMEKCKDCPSFLSTVKSSSSTSTSQRLQKVGVYYGNWDGYGRNFPVCKIPGDKIDYLFYSFLDPSTGTCQFSDSYLDLSLSGPVDGICGSAPQPSTDPVKGNMYQLMKLKQRFPNLKVIASIGGFGFSKAFHNYIGTSAARSTLVTSCVNLLKTYSSSIDGFDIDLEFPCISTDLPCGDNITPTSDDKGNFAALIQEFRKQLGSTPLLSIATSADLVKIQALDFTKLDPVLNFYNIMNYDFTGGEYGVAYTGHHTQLKANPADPVPYRKTLSAEIAAGTFVANGATPGKINIGVAFYGKSFNIAKLPATGPFLTSLGAPTIGTWEPAIFDYSDIVQNYLTSSNNFFDPVSQATYILDPVKGLYITYDDPTSVKAKTSFVRSKGYQGVFCWQIAGDTNDFKLTQSMGQ